MNVNKEHELMDEKQGYTDIVRQNVIISIQTDETIFMLLRPRGLILEQLLYSY